MEESSGQKGYGYGKRPLWQWVLLYIVIGAIVYGLIYYFVFTKKGGIITTTGQPPVSTQVANPTISPTQEQNTVTLTQNGWSPATLTIKAGQTVVWINNSGQDATVNSNPHPTHTAYHPLNLGSFSDKGTLSLKFDQPGTYGYHNHLNPNQQGTIIVN